MWNRTLTCTDKWVNNYPFMFIYLLFLAGLGQNVTFEQINFSSCVVRKLLWYQNTQHKHFSLHFLLTVSKWRKTFRFDIEACIILAAVTVLCVMQHQEHPSSSCLEYGRHMLSPPCSKPNWSNNIILYFLPSQCRYFTYSPRDFHSHVVR